MAWLWFVDTSRHADYILILAVDCLVAGMALVTAIATGLGLAAAGLTVVFLLLLAATWYARIQWRLEESEKRTGPRRAVKIRMSR